jgi:hypothetical protein
MARIPTLRQFRAMSLDDAQQRLELYAEDLRDERGSLLDGSVRPIGRQSRRSLLEANYYLLRRVYAIAADLGIDVGQSDELAGA